MPFAIDRAILALYYTPKGESAESVALMQRIDELFLKPPFYGARQMVRHLRLEGVRIGRLRASRHVLAWRLSNTLDAGFCVEALEEALTRHCQPEVFNTDQGSQFTGFAFTGRLQAAGVRISIDGRGRCLDNIVIERLWRSLKYEAVYLHDLTDGFEARLLIDEWIGFYNTERPHSALDGKTPAEAYRSNSDRKIYPKRFQRYDRQLEYIVNKPPSCPTNRVHLTLKTHMIHYNAFIFLYSLRK